ncbi:hypothetical protein Goarm_002180 [Gossypium armourianum]|uniref:FAD-dependent protein C-terminal domain-containing protein n=1 Tax=Gossypium armourianum TaxID=34283 RepID=A0A7J9K7B2_9ROSI|nr:hypothetical protein [Gossypium armourianum]
MDVSCTRQRVSKYAEAAGGTGRGKVPVADYKVVQYVNDKDKNSPLKSESINHSCYSFCMCPGGQVVLTSTSPSEICINGMSFSRRASRWANAALVVTVSTKDFDALNFHGPLAGVEFQREFERRAAIMGGGNFVVPVQTVSGFMDNKVSVTSMPSSSYRLGVKAASLHELFPIYMTDALRYSIAMFDKEVFYISLIRITLQLQFFLLISKLNLRSFLFLQPMELSATWIYLEGGSSSRS